MLEVIYRIYEVAAEFLSQLPTVDTVDVAPKNKKFHYRINREVSKLEPENVADAVTLEENCMKNEIVTQIVEMLKYGERYVIKIDKDINNDNLSTKISMDIYLREL